MSSSAPAPRQKINSVRELDGGESNVSMQGTRLARFMNSVDEVTGAMGEAEINTVAPGTDAPIGPSPDVTSTGADGIETDSITGRSYLKLPIPEPASVQRLADALSGLLSALRR